MKIWLVVLILVSSHVAANASGVHAEEKGDLLLLVGAGDVDLLRDRVMEIEQILACKVSD